MSKPISDYHIDDFPLFQQASEASKKQLAEHISFKSYHEGDALYEFGDVADRVYFIFDGAVKQQNITPSGKLIHLSYRRVGEYVGTSSVDVPVKHVCRAVCSEDSVIGVLDLNIFADIFLNDRYLAEDWVKKLVIFRNEQILIRTGKQILPSYDLVVIDLIRRAEKLNDTYILLPYRTEWAAYLGITPETLSRVITELKKKAPIEIKGDDILIHDLDALREQLSNAFDA